MKEVLPADSTAGSASTDVLEGRGVDDAETSEPIGAQPEAVSPIEHHAKPSHEIGAMDARHEPHERQDDDHIGVDWDLTVPPAHG